MSNYQEIPPVKQVRLGIIGLGQVFRFGYKNWFKNYLRKGSFKLIAIAEKNPKLLKRYSNEYHCIAFEEGEKLLEEAEINAVLINTPTWLHESLAIKAAERGIHVLCEKPMANSSVACWRMVNACKKNKVHLRVCFIRRFNKGFQMCKYLIQKGVIGEVFEACFNWPFWIPDIKKPPYSKFIQQISRFLRIDLEEMFGAWRLADSSIGDYGGIYLDHAPHITDFLRFCLQSEVSAVTGTSISLVKNRLDDTTLGILRFKNGTTAYIRTVLWDFEAWLFSHLDVILRGTQGTIKLRLPNTNFYTPPKFLTLYREHPTSNTMKILEGLGLFRGEKIRLKKVHMFLDNLEYFVRTLKGIRMRHPKFGMEDLAAHGEDGAIATMLVEKVLDAARSKMPIWLPIQYEEKKF